MVAGLRDALVLASVLRRLHYAAVSHGGEARQTLSGCQHYVRHDNAFVAHRCQARKKLTVCIS